MRTLYRIFIVHSLPVFHYKIKTYNYTTVPHTFTMLLLLYAYFCILNQHYEHYLCENLQNDKKTLYIF